MKRRIPSRHDLAPLMQFKKPEFDATRRRLDKALTIEDLRRIAKRRTPRAAFDYTDGSAEAELSIARARQAFSDIEFHPAILRDVSKVKTGWDVLGGPVSMPFGIAPTGFTRMMQTEGEIAGAHAAARAGIPVLAVHDGHHRHRGRQGGEPIGQELVSALHVEGPRPVDGAR
jgi:L-lactate dehydrogenase (cytochrome)